MSILMPLRNIEIYYFGLGANYMLTPFYVFDFLLYTVKSVCMCFLDMFCNQIVFFPCGSLECKSSI